MFTETFIGEAFAACTTLSLVVLFFSRVPGRNLAAKAKARHETVIARLFLDNILLGGLMAWGLPGIGFLATGLLGMAEKTSALIEAEATRKNHGHPHWKRFLERQRPATNRRI